jgi:uncharacterized metal-binding protein YceD (DUF177 family)
VNKSTFVVALTDLERGPRQVSWTITESWLRQALEGSEAAPRGAGQLDLELSKSGSEVLIRGHARVGLTMPCARTLDPVAVDIDPEIFLLLRPAATTDPGEGARQRRAAAHRRRAAGSNRGARKPKRRAARLTEDAELTEQDAAHDTYHGEEIVLDDFVREFILLDLPMFVVREDLRSAEDAAIAPRDEDRTEAERPIDPRLMPLAELASRLRQDKE